MKVIEDIGKLVPFLSQYPSWVQAVFLLTLFLFLLSIFLAVAMHPKLHKKEENANGEKIEVAPRDELYSLKRDLQQAIQKHYSLEELIQLYSQFGFAENSNVSLPNNRIDEFISDCIKDQEMLALLDAVLRKINATTAESKTVSHMAKLQGVLNREPGDFYEADFCVLDDGSINLSPQNSERVTVVVIFKSTGERFRVHLPLDIPCKDAARRIIAHVFFRDIPFDRRWYYLVPGADFFLVKREKGFSSKTLREAEVKNGDEISVVTQVQYPWAHNAWAASMLMQKHEERFNKELSYRLLVYARDLVKERLVRIDLELYGPP